jgi:hypothetical protein
MIERTPAGTAPPPEPAPVPAAANSPGADTAAASETAAAEPTPVSVQLQVLSTEHWSLLASRSLAWNEAFARAGMFLSVLSGAIVALALVAQADAFGPGFRIFALFILPVVLFTGLTTMLRVGIANYHDGLTVLGMNRIRAAYFERVPEVRRYFVMPGHDDDDAIWRAMGMIPSYPRPLTILASTPVLVQVINAVVAAAIGVVATFQLGADGLVAAIVGVTAFLLLFALQASWGLREALRPRPELAPMFPTPRDEGAQ